RIPLPECLGKESSPGDWGPQLFAGRPAHARLAARQLLGREKATTALTRGRIGSSWTRPRHALTDAGSTRESRGDVARAVVDLVTSARVLALWSLKVAAAAFASAIAICRPCSDQFGGRAGPAFITSLPVSDATARRRNPPRRRVREPTRRPEYPGRRLPNR